MADNMIKGIFSVLAEILDVKIERINLESSIENTRGWDSFTTWQFIVGIEKKFDISVSLEDAENFTSVEKVAEILKEKYLK